MDDDPALGFACQFFQTPAKLQLLSGEPVVAEPANLAECIGLNEDERPGHEFPRAANQVPQHGDHAGRPMPVVHRNHHANTPQESIRYRIFQVGFPQSPDISESDTVQRHASDQPPAGCHGPDHDPLVPRRKLPIGNPTGQNWDRLTAPCFFAVTIHVPCLPDFLSINHVPEGSSQHHQTQGTARLKQPKIRHCNASKMNA